jgi:hypothetical protein
LMDESTVRINSRPAAGVQDSEIMDTIHESEDNDEEYLEIENVLPGCLLQLRSSLLRDVSSRRKLSVTFDIVNVDENYVPQYVADLYRAVSISVVKPLQGEIRETWTTVPYPYESKIRPRRGRYSTRHDAHASVSKRQAYNHALAIRSAIVLALEPDVDLTSYPAWPEYVEDGEKITFGRCPFPDRQPVDGTSLGTFVRTPAMRSPDDRVITEITSNNTCDVMVADGETQTYDDQCDTDPVAGQTEAPDNNIDTPPFAVFGGLSMDPGREEQFYTTQMMVPVGYMTSCNVPAHLRGAPEPCLVHRRMVRDLEDNNRTLEDTYTMLYTPAHFPRRLCDEPRMLEITLLYCDRPHYNVFLTAEMAAPGATVRIGSKTKAARDFGIRRWFADAGCGRDLVSSSVVVQAGGKAYIQAKPPKYLNTANGITAVAKGVTMYIPHLDEIADIMCLTHTPSVLSIGKRCMTMGYAFFWPPFSEHPVFVKPDGSRVTMDVEGNIPYLTGETTDDACPAEPYDGPDTDDEDPDMANMPRDPITGRCVWEFGGGMDVPLDKQDYPPTPPADDSNDAPDSPHDAMPRPWPQTRWSRGHSPPIDDDNDAPDAHHDATTKPWPQTKWSAGQPPHACVRDNPAYEEIYPEEQDNDEPEASVESEEFDDVTPVGTPEDNDNDEDHAQGDDDIDDASSASSHMGPPQMIDSTSEDDDDARNRRGNLWADDSDDEDKEIEQLIFGLISSRGRRFGRFCQTS